MSMKGRKDKVIGFVLSEADNQRIQELATRTKRSRSGVIKWLLQQAQLKLTLQPEIVLVGDAPEGGPDAAA